MNKRLTEIRILLILALSASALCCASKSNRPEGQPPVIINSYAASAVRPGATYKVFLHVKDINGDMDYLRFMLYVPGFGFSPTIFLGFEKKDRDEFVGYLCLKTPAEDSLIGKKFVLKAIVRDARGNGSKPIRFTGTFASEPKDDISERWRVASKNRMKGIKVNVGSLNEWRIVSAAPPGDLSRALKAIVEGLVAM